MGLAGVALTSFKGLGVTVVCGGSVHSGTLGRTLAGYSSDPEFVSSSLEPISIRCVLVGRRWHLLRWRVVPDSIWTS